MLSVTMPRAFAGNDQTITTPTCSAQVALSGSGAVEGGGPVQLDWRANGVSLASGASATVELPAGVNLVELVATNAAGISSSDVVVITVVPDQIPIFDTVPDPITVDQGTSPLTPVSVPLATAHGACGPATVVSNAPDRFPAGTSPVVFTATDGLGKIASAATTVTVNPRVDLSIHRDEIPAPRRGEVVTYEYDIQNAGPGPAIGIVVDIDFSRPLTFVPYSNECTPGGAYCEDLEFLADGALCDLKEDGGMTCRFGSLDRSEIRSFSIRHRIGANDSGTITDTANVSAAGTDTNPANDTVQTSSTISVSVNLSVNGSVPDSSFPVVAGTIETIRVFVANTGEDVATQTVMEAELPAGVTFVSGDGCSAEGATVRCQVGSLAAFTGSRAALFDVRLDPSLEVLTFPLTVSSAEHDVQTENNRSELSPTAVSSESDLTVSLASEGDLVPGADFTVLATLANLGPSDARHNTLQMFILALLADGVTLGPLPAGCAQVTHLGPIGKQRIDCPDIRIDVGTSESFAFTFRLPPEDRTPPSRIVADAVGPSDIDDENNRAELTPALVPVANLVLTAAGDSAPVIAGETGTWTTTVTNQGPSQATGVVISAALPDDVTFDAAASPGCALSDGLVTCSVGALSPGDPPATVTVAGGIDGLARNSVSLPFSAGATESDPSPENEVAFENAVEVSIDQKLTMSVPAEVVAGQSLEWTATVSNAGPSTATAVTVALTLPTELREASGEDCTPNETGLTCVVATLAGGDSHEFQLTADVDPFAREPLAIAASVDAAETDENPGDNAAPNASVSILTDVELSLSVVSPDSAIAGETFDSAISVTNGGPSGATSVLVSLPAPEGTFAGDLGEGCEESAGGIECRTEALGPEGTQTFTIPLRIDPSARGKLVIDASMVAAEDDIPKTAGAATQIDALVDVSVAGTAPAEIVAGTELVYNLTIGNAGPSTATKPSLTVTLPPGVVPVSHEGCSTSSSVVTCTGDDLLPGASHEYQIIADVGPFERGDHDATLLGSAVETDSQPTNNEETITVNVTASADLSLALVDSPDPAVAGNVVTYLLTASNAGKSGATGVGIDVDLPPNAFFASASPECTRDGASLHCALGDMDVSASREIELRLVPMTAGSLVLSAEIHSQDPDPDAANNVASATTAVSGQGGGAAGAGDLDGDGDLDLAAVDTTADELVLFENDGGALAERLRVPVGHRPVSLALGDLDGDGRLDLAVANSVSNDVSIVRNESAWSFAETERPPIRGRGASSIAIGDFDGDGRLDLATSNELTADVSILLNRDAIAESYVVPLPGKGPAKHPSSIAAGDLDGDGRLDLAIANGVANSVSILTSGGGTFAGTALVTLGGGALHPSAMTIGDFNADGRLDLAVANREGNSISIVWNEGTGAFLAGDPVAVSKDPVAIAAADLDGNGRLDLAAALRTADAISVLFSGEDGFAAETIVETGKKPVAIVIGDFDGDGRLDLVTIGSPKVVPTIHLGR
ncbi:MAG: FG-GAP-like repeat-containing protein [Thermoanaerobaculia bacterium]